MDPRDEYNLREDTYIDPRPAPDTGRQPLPGKSPDSAYEKPAKETKQSRWRGRFIITLAVLLVVSGIGVLAGSYFYDSISEPGELKLVNNTEIFAADGTTQLAKLGSQNRVEVPLSKLAPQVQKALVAGEDKNFYEHSGIDMWGIARAAWNNVTGGETQGGSTITQQYARQAAGDLEISYARKVREAIMARKLEDNYSKDQILSFYLNTVYFGRGAHGIGAAAEAYFAIPPDQIDKLNVAQAAVLGAVLRQPEGKNGYDPANSLDNAKGRWNYVLNNMIEMKWLTEQEKSGLQYPAPKDPENPQPGELQKLDSATAGGSWGHNDRATGHIIKYIEAELEQNGVRKELRDQGLSDWRNAGLRIVTTIDPRAQAALEAQLNREVSGSKMSTQREKIIGAGVVINPANGRVVAYYGGSNKGTDTDWASTDEPHPPASSFKAYTLAAALAEDISTQSIWDASEMRKGVNGAEFDIGNAGRETDSLDCGTRCTLETLTIQSFNVAFFKVTRQIGTQKVVAMAHNAGVKTMWTDQNKPVNLDEGIPTGRNVFDFHVGFGQYAITVLDHATGMATIANHGMQHKPHFVVKVDRKDRQNGSWQAMPAGNEQVKGVQAIDAKVADEVTYVLKKIPGEQGHTLSGGRQAASKSGTWENGKKKEDGVTPVFEGANAHAWYVGYTEQLAAAIWVGSTDHNDTPIKETNGRNMSGSGLPGEMWEGFMNQAHKDMGLPNRPLTNGTGGKLGDPKKGEIRPQPSGTPTSPRPAPSPGKTTPPVPPPTTPGGLPTPTTPAPPTITPALRSPENQDFAARALDQ